MGTSDILLYIISHWATVPNKKQWVPIYNTTVCHFFFAGEQQAGWNTTTDHITPFHLARPRSGPHLLASTTVSFNVLLRNKLGSPPHYRTTTQHHST